MRTFQCQTSMPEVKGLESNKMTVGRHLILSCKGEPGENFDFSKAAIKTETKNAIRVFAVKSSSPDSFEMDFTLYHAGEVKLSDFILTDGANEIILKSNPVKVESVLKATQDGKPQEPYGAIFPIAIEMSKSYYFYAAALLLLLVIFIAVQIRRIRYFRKLKAKLVQYSSPVDPESQFYKAVRFSEKQGYPLPDLERAFKLYNLRSYKIPLFDLTNEKAIRYFRRNFPEYKDTRLQLQKILGEFDSLAQSPMTNEEHRTELVKKLYHYVEHNRGLSHE